MYIGWVYSVYKHCLKALKTDLLQQQKKAVYLIISLLITYNS